MKSKGSAWILIALIVLIGLFASGYFALIPGVKIYNVYTAEWEELVCTELKESVTLSGSKTGLGTVECPDPYAEEDLEGYKYARTVSDCSVWVYFPSGPYWFPMATIEECEYGGDCKIIYDSSTLSQDDWFFIGSISQGKKYYRVNHWTTGIFGIGSRGLTWYWKEQFTPFYLKNTETYTAVYPGEEVEQGCCPKLETLKAITLEDWETSSKEDLYGKCLIEHKNIPFVSKWVLTNLEGTALEHPQYGIGICQGNYFYPIIEKTFADGETRYLKQDVTRHKVECCPGTPGCGNDFKFLPEEFIEPEAECKEGWWYISGWIPQDGEVVKVKCINGKWQVVESKPNECLNCGVNEVCNSDYECVVLGRYEYPQFTPTVQAPVITQEVQECMEQCSWWDIVCKARCWWEQYGTFVVIIFVLFIVIFLLVFIRR